jgi:NitT/TauT family transport system ATP-binding protein
MIPPLILMDEPLGALDAMTREQLRVTSSACGWRSRRPSFSSPTPSRRRYSSPTKSVVISPRPGTIVRRVAVDLPRPRNFELSRAPPSKQLVTEIKQMFVGFGVI